MVLKLGKRLVLGRPKLLRKLAQKSARRKVSHADASSRSANSGYERLDAAEMGLQLNKSSP